MDFARKQLEKYGWTDGKGLGKHENGIAQALKPKLKRSVTGIGHDAAADFTEHWWTTLYNKAANNVEVLEKNGKTKKIKTKDASDFIITNSTWKLNQKSKKSDNDEQYKDYFVRTAVLTNGGVKIEKFKESNSDEEIMKKDVNLLSDAELLAACEGRTAHKGARHGLLATGKLARIAQQEQEFLALAKYKGYSHANNKNSDKTDQVIEEITLNDEADQNQRKKKKKKRKRCSSYENISNVQNIDGIRELSIQNNSKESTDVICVASVDNSNIRSKSKKIKDNELVETTNNTDETIELMSKSKKNKKRKNCDEKLGHKTVHIHEETEVINTEIPVVRHKKKKIK